MKSYKTSQYYWNWIPLAILVCTLSVTGIGSAVTIKHIDIIHTTHTDVGFTDQPFVCRETQKRYLDIAIDACLKTAGKPAGERFFWTAESTLTVDDWWRAATPARRKHLLQAVESGQLEIMALPCNTGPYLNGEQWEQSLHWLPDSLWRQAQPKVAMQNDVNGFPRAGAMKLLDRGVRFLMMGINNDSGGPPFFRPSAFWWRMPDGRRMFVWLSEPYGVGFAYFEEEQWRRGPVPRAAETSYRPPRPGEIFRTDEDSLRESHRVCVERLRELEAAGYSHTRLIIPFTNQWRMDNDPPFPPLADFVVAWNRLGLKPTLRLTTPSTALKALEEEIGDSIPVLQGEFTDWWANGAMSGPREVAASRLAKRLARAATSEVWGTLDGEGPRIVEEILRDLCLFDEHTWGSSNSVALPYSLDTVGQFAEKSLLAYRPMARAEWLLSQRARSKLVEKPEGLYVTNTASLPYSGWVRIPAPSLRGDHASVENLQTGESSPIVYERGLRQWSRPRTPADLTPENSIAVFADNVPKQVARIWVEKLPGHSTTHFRLRPEQATGPASPSSPEIRYGEQGWPTSIRWKGMSEPLFLPGTGDFISVRVNAFSPRWVLKEIGATKDPGKREQLRRQKLEQIPATVAGRAEVEETLHTLVITQPLKHPRLRWATRRFEVWKGEPRARLTLRIYRISSEDAERFYVNFKVPARGKLPTVSNGDMPFVPYRDQLPGTCRDYFAVDGWAHYETADGHWLWASRDAPLMALGSSQTLSRRMEPPDDSHQIMAVLFDNFWYTNFVADSSGVMEYQFDLVWKENIGDAAELADAVLAEPVVLMNPAYEPSPLLLKHLYRP